MDDAQEPTPAADTGHEIGDEIPVPKRSAWDRLVHKRARPKPSTDYEPTNPNEDEFWEK